MAKASTWSSGILAFLIGNRLVDLAGMLAVVAPHGIEIIPRQAGKVCQ
jgi:hypothetical protein